MSPKKSFEIRALLFLSVLVSVIMTLGMVSLLSVYFYGRVTDEFLITGFIASFLTSSSVLSIVLYFVRKLQITQKALAQSHAKLESRVEERTTQLRNVNQALRIEILEREKEEKERRALEERIQQAQKMEAIGQLAGGVAHDFNNIVCAIELNTDLALEELAEDSLVRPMLTDISIASQRAAALTRQLLAFSRREIIEPSSIVLDHLIQELLTMLQRLISEDIILSFVPFDGLWTVLADPSQMEQIIVNLAINARDSMRSGGNLRIETENVTREILNPDVEGPQDWVMISVFDTGCGMSKETKDKIFEPFFTTKGDRGGTGLGLATVLGIVEQSQGHLEVSSKIDEGSCFRIFLPRHRHVPDAKRPALLRSPKQAIAGVETVLIVEDDELVLKRVTMILRRLGYQVLLAQGGTEAIDLLKSTESEIDLLLTDVVMPHISGPELATKLRAKNPELAVIFMSGYDLGLMAPGGVLEKGIEFIAKPFSRMQLTQKIRCVLDERAGLRGGHGSAPSDPSADAAGSKDIEANDKPRASET